MTRVVATLKAIFTRLVFAAHGFIAIWQVTAFKRNPQFWYLSAPILVLVFEGVFTLTIKRAQEWKWFCPSVFLYLSSVVPAIWLLELDKVEQRLRAREETRNLTAITMEDLKGLEKLMGVPVPRDLQISTDTWVTLIEQFLMLVLIIGRWMLPKGELTRDQLSQLLLVYIGTAADIIEFFDSFKDDKIAQEPLLVFLTLAIWSWSLLQFTVVLTATKSRKFRLSASSSDENKEPCCTGCCSIDVWGIIFNILLQDAPFLGFRLLLIIHYRIISYMNVFFTCKNTLVILLQLYRLYVVHSESQKQQVQKKIMMKKKSGVSIIALSDMYPSPERYRESENEDSSGSATGDEHSDEESPQEIKRPQRSRAAEKKRTGAARSTRQDTGYSTASSSHGSIREAPSGIRKQRSRATMTNRNDCQEKRRRDKSSQKRNPNNIGRHRCRNEDEERV